MCIAHPPRLLTPQWLACLFSLLFFCHTPAQAQGNQRVALLIGNSSYSTAPLRNPPNDVREMEAALQAVGFKVQTVLNANQNQMKRAVRDFGNLAQGADVAFFYYSGHGTQANGENYLLPLGATIEKEADYEVEAVSANALMRQLASARPKAAIVVLDACRDNPYASVTKSTAKGLGRMDAPTGTMIAFATAPNTTASDEGHYARVLARQLTTPGLELFDVFRNTTAEVRRMSGGKQEPRVSEVSITDRIYLAGSGRSVPRPSPTVQISNMVPEPVPGATAPAQPTQAAHPQPGSTLKDCADCPELVVIPAGRFTMGSRPTEQALANAADVSKTHTDRESAQHAVSVRSFAAGKYAVTKGEFAAFAQAKGYQTEAEAGDGCFGWTGTEWKKDKAYNWRSVGFAQSNDHPVVCVSWNDAQAYIQWLNQTSGKAFRLLSEAEREYATRAGTQTAFWWGDSINTSKANYNGNFQYNGSPKGQYRQATVPVGSFNANPFGLYNVHGNVWEWTEDCFHDNYNGAPTDGSAWTTNCGGTERRAIRGGSWTSFPAFLRSASRFSYTPNSRVGFTGLRVARTLLTH
jgi:formylglycine-generating enzyme required for sulfatase activity